MCSLCKDCPRWFPSSSGSGSYESEETAAVLDLTFSDSENTFFLIRLLHVFALYSTYCSSSNSRSCRSSCTTSAF